MGASNVALLLTRWTRYLNDVPFRVAAQMCLTSLDGADPPQYFGGWAMLADAAGATYRLECGQRKGCRGCDGCRVARRTVTRALEELTDAGLIRLPDRAEPRHAGGVRPAHLQRSQPYHETDQTPWFAGRTALRSART